MFDIRVNELDQPAEIVDRDGRTVTALPAGTTRTTAAAVAAVYGWRLLPGRQWHRFVFAPGSFTRPVQRIPELWVGYGGWCPTSHPMRSTMLVASAPPSTIETDKPIESLFVACLECFREVTLDRLPAGEALDGPLIEYGIFEFDEPVSGPLLEAVARRAAPMRCMEDRHVDRVRATTFLFSYGHAVVAQVCPEHVGEMAAWCGQCPDTVRRARPAVITAGDAVSLTVRPPKSGLDKPL